MKNTWSLEQWHWGMLMNWSDSRGPLWILMKAMKIIVLLQKYLLSNHLSIVSNKTWQFTYSQKFEAHEYPVILPLTQTSDPLGVLRDFQYFFFHVKNITDPKQNHCFTEQPKFSCPKNTDKPKAADDSLHKYFLPWKHFLTYSWRYRGVLGLNLSASRGSHSGLLAAEDLCQTYQQKHRAECVL